MTTGRGGINGVVVGIVTNNKDPDGLGRVKVKFPSINPDDESNWARVATFFSGNEMGAYFLPEVDNEVLVAFENGNIDTPYIIGTLWNGKDVQPYDNGDGKNNLRVIKSRSGHQVILDDTDGEEKIEISDSSGKNMITLDTKEDKITISSNGDFDILASNGKMTIEAKEIELKGNSAVKMESGGDYDIKAGGQLNCKGSMINLN